MQAQLTIRPRRVGLLLGVIALLLSGLSLIADYVVEVRYMGSDAAWLSLVDLFSVNLELSLPTWYATILLFMTVALLALIALMRWQSSAADHGRWVGLALIFLYLSIDEGASIHEVAADPVTQWLNTSGYLYFGWQIVFVPLALIVALAYLGFVLRLPARTRNGFMIAGILYLGGAVVIEGFSAALLDAADGLYTYPYLVTATIEETGEMLGVVVMIYALLDYIVLQAGQVSINSETLQPIVSDTAPVDRVQNWLDSLRGWRLRHPAALVLGGAALMLIGWLALREIAAVYSDNLVLMFAAMWIIGLFVSALLRPLLDGLPRQIIGATVLLLHLTLPVWLPLLATTVSGLSLAILTVMLVVIFYSTYLPACTQTRFWMVIPLQVFGAFIGLALVLLLAQWGYLLPLIVYALLMVAVLFLLDFSGIGLLRMSVIAAAWLWFLPALAAWSSGFGLQQAHDLPVGTQVIVSDMSLHQKIVIAEDEGGGRYLFVDGVSHFDPRTDRERNIITGRIPASLMQPDNALVIGAGSMQMELMIANYAGHVITLETDARLADLSRRYFASYNFMDRLENRTIIIDGTRAHLTQMGARYGYDLIAVNHPATALPDAVQLRQNLSRKGVFAMPLAQPFTPENDRARQTMAALLQQFGALLIVNVGDEGYVYAAAETLPFSAADVQLALEATGAARFGLFETAAIRAIVGDSTP